jgi:hypothetical protein
VTGLHRGTPFSLIIFIFNFLHLSTTNNQPSKSQATKSKQKIKMCTYTLTQYILCHCKSWSLSSRCFRRKQCGVYPYPIARRPDRILDGRCEFCQEEYEEELELRGTDEEELARAFGL